MLVVQLLAIAKRELGRPRTGRGSQLPLCSGVERDVLTQERTWLVLYMFIVHVRGIYECAASELDIAELQALDRLLGDVLHNPRVMAATVLSLSRRACADRTFAVRLSYK